MDREVFLACGLFGSMSSGEVSALLGCLGARYKRLLAGVSMKTDRVTVVLSGLLVSGGERYSAGAALVPGGRPLYISALRQSEALFISPPRLLGICKNACPAHKKAIANLLGLAQQAAHLLTTY